MDNFVSLAKQAVEEYVASKKIINIPENLPKEFYSRKAGVFVTLYRKKELRGCIGTYLPTKNNIAEEIISNAIAACSMDNRFPQVSSDELQDLNCEISILSEPEPIKDVRKHNPKKYGIIVRCSDGRCGLLLPDLEGVDSADQQISIACQKGGINPSLDNIRYYNFTVEKHS